MKRGKKDYAKLVGFYTLVVAIILYAVFPFYYAILSSFKSGSALFEVNYFPFSLDFGNYGSVFTGQNFGQSIWNSVLVSFGVVALSLLLGLTGAFALARVRFRGRGLLLMTILGVSMFPAVAVLSGMFELIRFTGMQDSLWSLVFSYMIFTLPFTVWVLTTFMRDLPLELEEAAIMDGATPWQTITQVFMPLMWPALVTTGLLAFIQAWNEFLFALTFILVDEQRTVPVAIALMGGNTPRELPWGNIMAASVVVTLPVVALVLIFQRRIVAGLTDGAVKG
ncbi:MAG: carbohydrate ABC transporter permease [Proteobacteria bacterium]|nr:carbohydrate ABC transporter permease [Pseudomonadota bacterium]